MSMSALGQKQTSAHLGGMSALPPKADIVGRTADIRFVPKADIRLTCAGHDWGERRSEQCDSDYDPMTFDQEQGITSEVLRAGLCQAAQRIRLKGRAHEQT